MGSIRGQQQQKSPSRVPAVFSHSQFNRGTRCAACMCVGSRPRVSYNSGSFSVASRAGRSPSSQAGSRQQLAAARGPVVVIDNYDSFTYNLCQVCGQALMLWTIKSAGLSKTATCIIHRPGMHTSAVVREHARDDSQQPKNSAQQALVVAAAPNSSCLTGPRKRRTTPRALRSIAAPAACPLHLASHLPLPPPTCTSPPTCTAPAVPWGAGCRVCRV